MENNIRKVLISYGMSNDRMLLLTDAPKEEIEKWCKKYNEELENGNNIYLGDLKRCWYTKVIVDSETSDFDRFDIETIGYDEEYDLCNYYTEEQYKQKAYCYAERYGILEYTVNGNKMTYYSNYPTYLSEQRKTYKIVVNLDTMKEESRTQLKRWNKLGDYNMHK